MCSLKSVGGGSNRCLTLITQSLQKQELVIINISQIDINYFSVSKTSYHMFSFQKMLVNLLLKMSSFINGLGHLSLAAKDCAHQQLSKIPVE